MFDFDLVCVSWSMLKPPHTFQVPFFIHALKAQPNIIPPSCIIAKGVLTSSVSPDPRDTLVLNINKERSVHDVGLPYKAGR